MYDGRLSVLHTSFEQRIFFSKQIFFDSHRHSTNPFFIFNLYFQIRIAAKYLDEEDEGYVVKTCKNAQVVTNQQTCCNKSVDKFCLQCLFQVVGASLQQAVNKHQGPVVRRPFSLNGG